jgi:hypothetical protein
MSRTSRSAGMPSRKRCPSRSIRDPREAKRAHGSLSCRRARRRNPPSRTRVPLFDEAGTPRDAQAIHQEPDSADTAFVAALETLAVIAYKQPVTIPEIQKIRGVRASGVIKTLRDRKIVLYCGPKGSPRPPIFYKTTRNSSFISG